MPAAAAVAENEASTPWARSPAEIAAELRTNLDAGLTPDEAARRLEKCGPNQIAAQKPRSKWKVFLSQFADLMIGLLAAAAVVSVLVGDMTDAVLIALIVIGNAVIGFIQEWRAEQALEALRDLSRPHAKVRRDGVLRDVLSQELVPGDIVEIAAGDHVPADARVVAAVNLEVVEATLTGESLPVEKTADALPGETGLPDRTCMLHAGTAVAQGRGRAIVAATGMRTELGRIAELLQSTEAVPTPLQQRLTQLSRRLAAVVVVVCVVIFVVGIVRERPEAWDRQLVASMLLTAVSLAVAAIPEGLPAVITVALALGSQRMAARRAIVRKLSAVETLGSVDVICTDKTGTLTQNRMTAADMLPASDSPEAVQELLRGAVLCSNVESDGKGEAVGSPTEAALVSAAQEQGADVAGMRRNWPRLAEVPFSSSRKRMTTLHRTPHGGRRLFVKGAIERILDRAGHDAPTKDRWQARADELAKRGRRVIAVAARDWDRDELPQDGDSAETDLELLGLFGIVDPVRTEAAAAIAECRSAGIHAVMITGDHPDTALAIADEIGLRQDGAQVLTGPELEQLSQEALIERVPHVSVYARVSPEHKLRIVDAWQTRGSITAMTGDGVNDAPALRQADVGVAMGITCSDVAKEAGVMVLADDNFATIVAAVEEGRTVYDNIRKFVNYLLTTNAAEVLVLLACIAMGLPLPLLPAHILWINLVTDGLPALALGFEPAEPGIMRRHPRKRGDSLFADGLGWAIGVLGALMAAACIILFWLELPAADSSEGAAQLRRAQTMVFLTLSLLQLFHVMAIRSSAPFYQVGLWSNYRLTVAVLLGAALQFAVIYVPQLQPYLHTVALPARDAILCVAVSTLPFVVIEIWKQFERRR
ncbi:MAG: cation-transporting P-type ATPase [Planctomycetaceae bacterium]|nr:cation-transporting P-type ATPase [Planctomycetaceae bacterium]